jgi:hypothetical protein
MAYDETKVDDAVLALLYLTTEQSKYGARAWKGQNWDSLDRLFEKGFICDPKSKAKSVIMTEEGLRRSEELFKKLFGKE